MATKKDLVDAQAFSRRRLVTAFVSGAPGGREVEPVRPGRVLIGGMALSVLLMAGAAIAGFLLGRPPAEWLKANSFVISQDTGEQYVVLRGGDDPVIQRVPNYVSAQLLLGQAELTPSRVRDIDIRTVRLGENLGIEGAPASLPTADELVNDGWTACTAPDTEIKIAVQQQAGGVDLAGSAFLVSSDKKLWLIATSPSVGTEPGSAYRFAMPTDEVMAYVDPSAGAYVRSGSDGAATGRTPYVIDTLGRKYALRGASVPDLIGYGTVDPPLVPSTWLEFFESGVSLSTNGARRVPEDASRAGPFSG